jgi:hypothetical protein
MWSASLHQPANRTGCAGAAHGICFVFYIVRAELFCGYGCVVSGFVMYVLILAFVHSGRKKIYTA